MSRHRGVRGRNYSYDYDDDYYDDDEYYDEDEAPASPSTAQYMFNRGQPADVPALDLDASEEPAAAAAAAPAPAPSRSMADELASIPRRTTSMADQLASIPRKKGGGVTVLGASVPAVRAPSPPPAASPTAGAAEEKSTTPRSASSTPSGTPTGGRRQEAVFEVEPPAAPADGRVQVSMVVVGHVDAGKSTLLGHLLVALGQVDRSAMRKNEQQAQLLNKASFHYAFVLDSGESERSHGVTMNVAERVVETPHRRVLLLDTPGHRDFVAAMISGASRADAALLVVPAPPNEFAASFVNSGQTREHALLCKALGVTEVIVAVNKLDLCDWSEERFNAVRAEVLAFLTGECKFKPDEVRFVPLSGLTGENLVERSAPELAWYHGSTLFSAVDALSPAKRLKKKPLRVTVSDLARGGARALSVHGRVESGAVGVSQPLLAMPGSTRCTVSALRRAGDAGARSAGAGDEVELTLTGVDETTLHVGSVLCAPQHPVPVVSWFSARVFTMPALARPLVKGDFVELFTGAGIGVPAVITRLRCTIDGNGQPARRKPRFLPQRALAEVEVRTRRAVCLEPSEANRRLGRVTFRMQGVTIAAGLVLSVVRPQRRGVVPSSN